MGKSLDEAPQNLRRRSVSPPTTKDESSAQAPKNIDAPKARQQLRIVIPFFFTAVVTAGVIALQLSALGGSLWSHVAALPQSDTLEESERLLQEDNAAQIEDPVLFNDDKPIQEEDGCRIFMAPSSLKGVNGLGLYTTRAIRKDEAFLNAPDGPDIPVPDFEFYPDENDPLQAERNAWIDLFGDYWWARGVADQVANEANNIIDYQITFGSLPNHHCVLHSIDNKWPDTPYDDTLVTGPEDPGAGGFSYHMGRKFVAARDLDAGDEIFLDYGYCNHNSDREPDPTRWEDHIAKTDDFIMAARLTYSMWAQQEGIESQQETDPSHLHVDPLNVVALTPKTIQQANQVMASRKGNEIMDIARSIAKQMGTHQRSENWIIQNGMCIENLVPRKSTLEHAGQGAFAQWALKEGDMVVPVPLLHILDRDVLVMYNEDGDKIGKQLLLNYCFGHDDTSLLLCPDTNAILINHCSSRQKQCGPQGPNAKVQWASGWDKDSDRWLGMSMDGISAQSGRGLAMEIVATRDIQPGEEVFIDYGKGWEDAWNEHVQNWKPTESSQEFISLKELNDDTVPISTMLVSDDLRQTVDHPDFFTGCVYWSTEDEEFEEYYEENRQWRSLSPSTILETYATDQSFDVNYTNHRDNTYWPCTVAIQEDVEGTRYTVRIHQAEHSDKTPWEENDVPRFLTGYPRSSIRIFRKPYTSDQYLQGAFRHYIGIPNGMLPEKWRNRKDALRAKVQPVADTNKGKGGEF